jgi:hypothetical protein
VAGSPGYLWSDGASTINIASSTQTNAVYRLYSLLVAAGWVHQASADGSTVSNTPGNGNTKIVSSGAMGNSNSWFVLAQPAIANGIGYPGHSQILVAHGTTQALWLVALIPPNTDGTIQASSGNGTATVPPTYTTAVEQIGTLPNTKSNWANTGTYSFTIGAMNVPPYNFHMYSWGSTGDPISAGGGILFDNIIPGSGTVGDNYPAILICENNAETAWIPGSALTSISPTFANNSVNGGRTYVGFNQSYVASCPVALARLVIDATTAAINVVPNGLGLDPISWKEAFLPAYWVIGGWGGNYGHLATPLGTGTNKYFPYAIKGASSSLHWQNAMWTPGSMQSKQFTKDVVAMGSLWFPHDGSTQLALY